MHIYEYLFTALIIFSILLASFSMVSVISEPSRIVSEKEQFKVAAQKLMTQILLGPGDPPEWGSNLTSENDLKTFGLSKYSETTRETYVLDTDKVLRLNNTLLKLDNTRSLFISPSFLRNLLNLGNEYGLALEFSPVLFVNVNRIFGSDKYEVKVNSENGGLPITGANVTARMYYYDVYNKKIANTDVVVSQTSYNGQCVVEFDGLHSEMKILTLVVEYYGVRIVKVFPTDPNLEKAYLFGEYLFLNKTCIPTDQAYEILVTRKAGRYAIEVVETRLDRIDDGKFKLAYVEPSTVALLTVSEDGRNFILALRETTLSYSLTQNVWSFPFAYSLERTALIGGSFYVVRLYLWRMSW